MKHSDFVHLHVHTEYSILDSVCRIRDLVKKAEEYKMPALAMTDNSVLFGAVHFYETCKSAGIKPIIGAEVYVAPKNLKDKKPCGIPFESHTLTLLVKDEKGYQNLSKLLTTAQFDGFYYRPRIDKELLSQHAKGLICLSGNAQSEIFSLLFQDRLKEAEKVADFYANLFGKEHFYLEIQDHGLEREKRVNPKLMECAAKMKLKMTATNDCHYLNRDDFFAHDIARCIYSGVTINEFKGSYGSMEYYFKSPQEMNELFAFCPEAVHSTKEIAERCYFDMDLSSRHVPEFNPPTGVNRDEYLLELCRKGIKGRVDNESVAVKERLLHEIDIIKKMGFVSYFLIVADFIHYAKSKGIPVGPGRGSAAGSLVAYLLGITEINPLHHDLLFERFLNPDRMTLPDIDIDFCYDRRSEVIEYVRNTYGEHSVAQIITFGTLAARAVIRDVGRVLGIPLSKVDLIAKMIPAEPKMTLVKALDMETSFRELIKEDKEVERLFNIAVKLEGLPRNTSTHAAGIIIAKGDLTDKMPLYPGQDKEVITQFDGPSCEKIGLLKMDFLGLKTLTVLHNTLKRVREQGPDFPYKDLNAVPDNDSRTYDLLNKANTLGVFQLESSGMRDLMKRLGVHEFSDVVALVALYRPGPMQMAEDFIQRKHGKVPVEYLHPCLEPILKETFGIMLYQEQVMQCAQVMADFSMTEADNLRRIMGKKKEKDMKLQHDKFVNGAVNRGISREIADQTFSTMEYFAGYGFNKSHSVAYGRIAYQTAWFKTNYPKEFMAALLSSEKNDTDKIYLYIEECRSMGIEVKPPSIQYSYVDFNVEKNSIRYGLSAIKNVGEGAAQAIVRARGKEPFESITHFAKKVDSRALNKKTLESLIKAGAFDELEKNRHYLFEITDDIIRFGSGSQKDQALGQESFFTILDSASSTLTPKKKEDYPNWPDHDTLRFERELLGCYLSGHPLVKYFKLLKRFSTTHTKEIIHFKDGDSIKIGGVISFIRHTKTSKDEKMAILQLEDLKGTVEIVVFPRKLKECEPLLKMESPVFIQGTMHSRNKVPGIILENITPLQDVQEKLTTSVLIRIDESEGEKGLNQLKEIIHKYPGRSQVLLDLQLASGESMMVSAENGLTLLPSESAISEIESLLGEDSVWLRIKDKPRQTFNPRRK